MNDWPSVGVRLLLFNKRNFGAMRCYVALRAIRSFIYDYKYFAQMCLVIVHLNEYGFVVTFTSLNCWSWCMPAVIARFSRGLLVKSRDSILHQICRHISIGEIRRLGGQSVGSAFAPLGRELPYKRDWCRRRSLESCGTFPDQRLVIEPRQSAELV